MGLLSGVIDSLTKEAADKAKEALGDFKKDSGGSDNSNTPSEEVVKEEKDNTFGKKIVEIAKKLLGKPYQENGETPDGFDVGGFVYYVYKQNNCELKEKKPDTLFKYLTENGGSAFDDESIAINGDLVFYKDPSKTQTADNNKIFHVGIYTDGSTVIQVFPEKPVTEEAIDWIKKDKVFVRFGNTIKVDDSKKAALQKASTKGAAPSDSGFRKRPVSDKTIEITKLPEGLTYCEPIYPDYVTVSDFVPAWALKQTVETVNEKKENPDVLPDNDKSEDAKEIAPNGKHYKEKEITSLTGKGLTREKAIEQLSKTDKYKKQEEVKKETDKK